MMSLVVCYVEIEHAVNSVIIAGLSC